MRTCIKHHQSALGEVLLCWVSYSVVSKPSHVINWWVMSAGDRRKIDEVGNTVMYPLLPQQHGVWNYYPELLSVDFKSVCVFISQSMWVIKTVNKTFLYFHMLINLMRRGTEFKLWNCHSNEIQQVPIVMSSNTISVFVNLVVSPSGESHGTLYKNRCLLHAGDIRMFGHNKGNWCGTLSVKKYNQKPNK